MKAPLAECLAAFKKDVPDAIMKLSGFCGVSHDTASRWNAKRLPKGEPLNKLWYLLDAHGYTVNDIDRLDPVVKFLGEALAFKVVSAQDLRERLNIGGHEHYLWRVLQGKLLPLVIRKNELRLDMLETESELLQLAKSEALANGILTVPAREGHVKVPLKPVQREHITQPSVNGRADEAESVRPQPKSVDMTINVVAASQLCSLKPLLEHINSGGQTARQEFRALIGDDEFYAVLDLLKGMSSRKANEYFQQSNS